MKFHLPLFRKSIQAPASTSEIAFQLALISVLMFAIYLLGFVGPYGLAQWSGTAQLNIAKMTHNDTRAALAYFIAFGILFALYWFAARRVLGQQGRLLWIIVISGAVAFSAVMLFLYPVDALDIFDYISRGRMQAFYGGNPFYQPPNLFRSDPLYAYTGWTSSTTAYGPGWEMLAAVVARLAGNSIVVNILAFKLVNVAAYAGTLALVAVMLRRYAPGRALFGVLLFGWNPLVVYVVSGNGHNDALMVFFVVLGFFFLARGNFTWAALAQVAGALVKFIPALLFPLMLLAGWKRMKTKPERISYLLITGGASLILTLVVFMPYYRGGDFLGTQWRSKMLTTSLPMWGAIILEQKLGLRVDFSDLLVSRAAVLLLGAWMARHLLRLARRQDDAAELNWTPYVQAGLSILLFYLLVTCLWFQPWYAIWGVALAALLPDSGMTRATIFFSMMSNWKMLIFDYLIVHGGPIPPLWQREWPLTALTLGPSWAFFLYQSRRLQTWPRRVVQRRHSQPQSRLAIDPERE